MLKRVLFSARVIYPHLVSLSLSLAGLALLTYEYYIYYILLLRSGPRAFVSNFGPAATVAATTASGFQKGCKTALRQS